MRSSKVLCLLSALATALLVLSASVAAPILCLSLIHIWEAFVRSVISEVHAPGNDGIQFYFVAISALSAAALRRLRSATRLRAQFGRRNSLQEGFLIS